MSYYQYGLEWDGDHCTECRRPVDDDVKLCDDCAPCPSCHGAGGLIIECPRGCMTRDGAA